MELERTDQEQVEDLQKWWQENRVALIGGLVLGIGALLGWERWEAHSESQAMGASQAYEAVATAVRLKQADAAGAALVLLRDQYPGSVYLAHGLAARAQLAAESNDWGAVVRYLSEALDTGPDAALAGLLRLRLARAHWAAGDAAQAQTVLNGKFPEAYRGSALALRGDIALAQGDTTAAKAAWTEALPLLAGSPEESLVSSKLERLGEGA